MDPPARHPALSDADIAKQPRRLELVQEMVNKGVFTKIEHEPGALSCSAYVGRAWSSLTIDEKSTAASVVFVAFAVKSPGLEFVLLYDGYTGRSVGAFDAEYGLKLD